MSTLRGVSIRGGGGLTENTVLSVEAIVLHLCDRSAMQVLETRIFRVANLYSSIESKVSCAKYCPLLLRD